MIANIDIIVPAIDPITPRIVIRMFFVISNFDIPWSQKQSICRIGGNIRAIAALDIAPTKEMKLSSCGIIIASAPV